jgi:mycothiol synthase
MRLIRRPFRGREDFAAIMQLGLHAPVEQFSATALPYQLSSWALDEVENVGLWVDESGELMVFALLQVPFTSLIYLIHPYVETDRAEEAIFAWAVQRGQAIALSNHEPFTLTVLVAQANAQTADRVRRWGFARREPGRVLLVQTLAADRLFPTLPTGFHLRHLRGADEAVVATTLLAAAFSINTVSETWRRRILQRSEYIPELDVVVEAPDGRLASFCLCWLNPNGQIGQIEPMGTHPDFQRLGLGQAALLEGLRRLQALGATTAYVGTSATNVRSLPLYHSVGFRLHHAKASYQRTFLPA